MKYEVTSAEKSFEVEINTQENEFKAGNFSGEYEFIRENGRNLLRIGTVQYVVDNVSVHGADIEFTINGNWHSVKVKDEEDLLLDRLGFKRKDADAEETLKSPMPGKILAILVKEGDVVTKGQRLAILEAMKMENELKSPIDGTIKKIEVKVGDPVEKKTPILEIE